MADLVASENELPVFIGTSYEDHISAWIQASQEIDERQWMLGAIAASLETTYGDRIINKFAGEVMQPARTIWQYAQVYNTFEKRERSQILSWSHHLIASLMPDPVGFLHQAEDEGWSVREMRFQAQQRKLIASISQSSQPGTTCTLEDLDELVKRGRKFGTIYADPPWSYGNQGTRAATDNHYPTMTVEEIAALPIGELAAENAHLHLWTTNAFLFECQKLFAVWGFEYKSAFIWVKPQMGIGNYWRVSHEFMLLGVRGSLPFIDHSLMSWAQIDRTEHSKKPERVRLMIEKASPGPRLELFARHTSLGWTSWGNEIERSLFDVEEAA